MRLLGSLQYLQRLLRRQIPLFCSLAKPFNRLGFVYGNAFTI